MSTAPSHDVPKQSRWGQLVALVGVVGILLASSLAVYLRMEARRSAKNHFRSSKNLRILALAMEMYHDSFGSFPPAIVRNSDGEPLYSGRVLLLPFIEQQSLYDEFHKTQPWDSFPNTRLARKTPWFMSDPSSIPKVDGQTDYLFVVGKGTIFEPPAAGSNRISMTDGSSHTLCMVEVK